MHEHVGMDLVGGQRLMQTLTCNGRPDLADKLATQKTYPSWGYTIERGAPPFGSCGTEIRPTPR